MNRESDFVADALGTAGQVEEKAGLRCPVSSHALPISAGVFFMDV